MDLTFEDKLWLAAEKDIEDYLDAHDHHMAMAKEAPMPTSINEPQTPAFEEVAGQVPPTITALEPDYCALGDPDFTLKVSGEGLSANSTIFFAGHDEPTSYNEDGTVSTGVKPSLWGAPVVVQCYVRNGTLHSNPLEFTFAAPSADEEAEAESSSRNRGTGRFERRR
jgi:hypothetical protein